MPNARRLAVRSGMWTAALVTVLTPVATGQDLMSKLLQPGDDEAKVSYTDRGTIELHASERPLSEVLQLLALLGKCNIIASPAVNGTVTASLYDVELEEALDCILKANNAGFIKQGKFIYVYTLKELADILQEAPVGRVFYLNYITAAEAKTVITPLLSDVGQAAVSPEPEDGIGSSADNGGGQSWAGVDYIFVLDRPAVLENIDAVLTRIDVRPRQVLMEATILRASLTDDNALGIDFSLVGGVDLELLGSTSNGITDLTLGQLPPERLELFNSNITTSFTGDVPPGGVTIGVIKDHVAVFLRALEQVTDTSVIANPKILTLNKQKGQVIVGRRDGYLTTTFTDTVATQTIEFLETGTQLIFRPFIGDDGFIRVELHPEDSTGGVDSAGLPFEHTTEVTTNVVVRDGHTILIGGLFREVTTDTRSQVPILGDVPGLGTLFQSRQDSTQREEVIILLTVHVVKDDTAYADASVRAMENIERMRVGLRAGLMWHGRERLAQRHYRRALEHVGAGQQDKALWDLNMALHNYPRFMRAIELKESLLEQREWEEDGVATRAFIHRLIAAEAGSLSLPYGCPPMSSGDPDDGGGSSDDDNTDSSNE